MKFKRSRDRHRANGPGNQLRALRKRKGMSQRDLSRKLRMHPSALSLIERGLRDTRMSTWTRIATGLGVDVARLFPPQARRQRSQSS